MKSIIYIAAYLLKEGDASSSLGIKEYTGTARTILLGQE